MTAAIVVELPGGDAGSPLAADLLQSCSVGSQGRARCVEGPSDQGIAVAFVAWDGAHVRVRIDVGVRGPGGWHRLARTLAFSVSDPEPERWRAAGFAIATVVGDVIARDRVEPEPGPTPAPAVLPPAPEPTATTTAAVPAPARAGAREQDVDGESVRPSSTDAEPRRRTGQDGAARAWWLDARFAASIDVRGSPVALGGVLAAARAITPDRWFVVASLGATASAVGGVSIVRPQASAGLGLVAVRASRVRFALRLEPVVEIVLATGTDSTGATGRASRWLLGGAETAEVSWQASDALGVVVAGQARELGGATAIQVHGQGVADLPPVSLAAQAGLRLSLP